MNTAPVHRPAVYIVIDSQTDTSYRLNIGSGAFMITTACPSRETLQTYLQGHFESTSVDAIEEHLEHCHLCEQTAAELEHQSDSLMRFLPLAANREQQSSDHLEAEDQPPWIKRLMEGPPTPQEMESLDELLAHDSTNANVDELSSYELLEVLGKGGMGVVYRGRHRQLGRQVAIKVVRPRHFSSEEAQRRFDREIQILGGLQHSGIVMATDAGRIGPAAYLVMELIDGIDLAKLVRASGPLNIEEACELARQIALALAAAHEANAIHRDVKPSNVMIDREGRIKLLDFGLAYLVDLSTDHRETSLGRLIGTLDYMAPEQTEGEPVTQSADLYGLGATLFYLLAGRPPHITKNGASLLAQLKAISFEEAPRLDAIRPNIPVKLADLVESLLSRDIEKRPTTASEVADRLSEWAEADSVKQVAKLIPDQTTQHDSTDVRQSLSELLETDSKSSLVESSLPAASAGSGRGWRRMMWLAGMAGFFAAMIYGIIIIIETPEGTLRIESDLDDIQIELVDESERTKSLEITEGEDNSTELKAGKYRIRIAGGHDNLKVTPDIIELRRGETQVAKITQIDQVPAKGNQTAEIDRPLFQGKTEAEWEALFEAEQDPVAKLEAATALVQLYRPLDDEERVENILRVSTDFINSGIEPFDSSIDDQQVDWWRSHPALVTPLTGWSSRSFPELKEKWNAYYSLVSEVLFTTKPGVVADQLTELVESSSKPRRMFALAIFAETNWQYIVSKDPLAVERVASGLRDASDLSKVDVFLRFRMRFTKAKSGSTYETLRIDVANIGQQYVAAGIPNDDTAVGVEWLGFAEDLKVDPDLQAKVLLELLKADPTLELRGRLHIDLIYRTPDFSTGLEQLRSHYVDLWTAWLGVACDWLEGQTQETEVETAVLRTFCLLIAQKEQDDWPNERIARILETYLCRRHTDLTLEQLKEGEVKDPSNFQLLESLLLCGGEIPECITTFPPDPRIREHIAEHEKSSLLHLGSSRPATLRMDSHYFRQLPYQLTSVLLANSENERQHELANLDGSFFAAPSGRMDLDLAPLVPLALVANIAKLGQNRLPGLKLVTLRSNRVRLSSQGASRSAASEFSYYSLPKAENLFAATVVEKWARRLHKQETSPNLKEELESIFPDLIQAPEQPIDPETPGTNSTEPIVAPTEETTVELLYQGKTESEWQALFEAETDPIAKLDAASALVTIYGSLDDGQQIDAIIRVVGDYINAGTSQADAETREWSVSQLNSFAYSVSTLDRWNHTSFSSLGDKWRSFYSKTKHNISHAETPERLAERLIEFSKSESYGERLFALALLESIAPRWLGGYERTSLNLRAFRIVLDGLSPHESVTGLDTELRLRASLVVGKDFPTEIEQVRKDLNKVGELLLQGELLESEESQHAEWLKLAEQFKLDPHLRARVALEFIKFDAHRALDKFGFLPEFNGLRFSSHVTYDALKEMREGHAEMWGPWLEVACDWLDGQQEETEVERAILDSFSFLFAQRKQDDWSNERVVQVLSKYLVRRHQSIDAKQFNDTRSDYYPNADLLLLILAAGGEIPEEIRTPPESEEVRKGLSEFRQRLAGFKDQISEEQLDELRGTHLSTLLPYQFYESVLKAAGSRELVPFRSHPDLVRKHPIGPLVDLAVAASIAGESQASDESITHYLGQVGSDFSALARGIKRNDEEGYTQATIFKSWLTRIHEKAVSPKLKSKVESILPELAKPDEPLEPVKD